MPFSKKTLILKSERKENFVLTFINKLPLYCIKKVYLTRSKRASAFTSVRGSMTVEASLAVPLFFMAFACFLYLMEIMAMQTNVRSALQYAQKELATKACETSVITPNQVQELVIQGIGEERLQRSILVGGAQGINCSGSFISPLTGIGQLKATYKIRIPVPIFRLKPIPYEQTMGIKVWNGYRKGNMYQKQEIVYITESGLVYHKNYHCTYLELSIHAAKSAAIKNARNRYGGKYHPCERCATRGKDAVYITDTGNKYHGSVSCSGLKRTVYAVLKSEVSGKSACSKCGG